MNGLNYIRVDYNDKELLLLVDSGASVSVFSNKYLGINKTINKSTTLKIQGIGGSTVSRGSAELTLQINNVNICHEFLIIDNIGQDIHGVIGIDFLQKHAAKIDFEKFVISIFIEGEQLTIPLESKHAKRMTIPARCQLIKNFRIQKDTELVTIPGEICEGVFVAGSLVRPKENFIPIRILNTRDEEITLQNFTPNLDSLENYHICAFNDIKYKSVNRVDKVLSLIKNDHLNQDEHYSIQRICAKYADVFQIEGDPLTVTNVCKQSIQVNENISPVYVKPYRLPHAQKSEVELQINKMLKDGIIEEAKSSWSSPILIVPKRLDQSGLQKWRIVIDYRLLNKQIKDDKFPLPSIIEILDSLSGAIYFSHLDLSQGYYQIELDKKSRPCTAFTTDKGQYQMKRLPMGLKISPNAFSRAMTIAMSGLNYDSCFIYLDDLIVFGNNLTSHNKNLTKVLQRLRDVNLKLNPHKCEFLKKEIFYLGHVISAEGISPDPSKIIALQNYPVPKDANETKRFVAFANYYRRHIKNFAQIAVALNSLLKKNAQFLWSEECQLAFDMLKNALSTPPILQYPDFSPKNCFTLKTDASGYAIGAVLSNGNDKPVAYASRSLNQAEKNYCTIEKELLAIVWAVKHFRPYLFGRKFLIYTDHRPLVYLYGMSNPSSRLTKFRCQLEEYDFTVEYITGKRNTTADALSRIILTSDELKTISQSVENNIFALTRSKTKEIDENNFEKNTNSNLHNGIDHPGVVELLKKPDEVCKLRLIDEKEFNELKLHNKTIKIQKKNNIKYDEISNVIYMKWESRSASSLDESLRDLITFCRKVKVTELVIIINERDVPLIKQLMQYAQKLNDENIKLSILKNVRHINDKDTKQLIMNDFHMLPTGGHAGINRMYQNIKRYYFWSGIRKDVEHFVKHCDDCQRFKYKKKNIEPLTITTTASTAFQRIYLDLVGPLEVDAENKRYIITIQCELSKYVEAYAIENKEAETVAEIFVKNFILRYGIPNDIITDQGTEFLASLFVEVCKLLKICQLHSTAYHHETLGSLENSHKCLGAFLRMQITNHQEAWSTWLPYWCFAYNNTVHTETRYTPFELVFGKSCNLPSNIENQQNPLYNFDSYPHQLKYRLQQACNDAKNNLILSKEKRKLNYDKKSNEIDYRIGQLVLLRNDSGLKMDPLFKGPYEILEIKSPNVAIKVNNKITYVHKNRIKMYYSTNGV